MVRRGEQPVDERGRRRGGVGTILKRFSMIAVMGGGLVLAYARLRDPATRRQLGVGGAQLKERAAWLAEQAKLHATTLRR